MKTQRPRWDFGRKVQQLLLDRTREAGHPVRAADLARDLDLDHGTVMDWITLGRSPRSKTGHAVAEWFRVDPAWLLNDEAPYPPPSATSQSLEALLRAIPAEERRLHKPIPPTRKIHAQAGPLCGFRTIPGGPAQGRRVSVWVRYGNGLRSPFQQRAPRC